MQNFICRKDVLAILNSNPVLWPVPLEIVRAVEALPAFPAPNPDWEKNNRNVMGQTEEEFWTEVEARYPSPGRTPQ